MLLLRKDAGSLSSRSQYQRRSWLSNSARIACAFGRATSVILIVLIAFSGHVRGQGQSLPANSGNGNFVNQYAQVSGNVQDGSNVNNNPVPATAEPLPPPGRQMIVRPPMPVMNNNGQLSIQPSVEVLDQNGQSVGPNPYFGTNSAIPPTDPTPSNWFSGSFLTQRLPLIEPLPPAAASSPEEIGPSPFRPPAGGEVADPSFGDAMGGGPGFFGRLFGYRSGSEGLGIGHERVMLAPFEIEASQPFTNIRFREDSALGYNDPSRGEYLWASPTSTTGMKGPIAPKTDYTDIRFMSEIATGKSFSLATEIPIRLLYPDGASYTAGMSDMNVATKLVMINGQDVQLTQLFRTYFPTGDATRGIGNGHFSMEPGLLGRYKWSPETYFHAQLKYWFAIPSAPLHPATVLEYGAGVTHLYYENDICALMTSLEFVASTLQNSINTATDGTMVYVCPGVRIASDKGGDLGLFELGVSGNIGVGDQRNRWYNSLLRLEFRWSY